MKQTFEIEKKIRPGAYVIIPISVVEGIANYLRERPYRDVAAGIDALKTCEIFEVKADGVKADGKEANDQSGTGKQVRESDAGVRGGNVAHLQRGKGDEPGASKGNSS